MSHAYTEDLLVEQLALGLFGEIVWQGQEMGRGTDQPCCSNKRTVRCIGCYRRRASDPGAGPGVRPAVSMAVPKQLLRRRPLHLHPEVVSQHTLIQDGVRPTAFHHRGSCFQTV